MIEFNILNSPEKAFYFNKPDAQPEGHRYLSGTDCFYDYNRKDFIDEINKYIKPNTQAGYSKSKKCNYLCIILVLSSMHNGDFDGYRIKSTHFIEKDNKVSDVHDYGKLGHEADYYIETLYHPLPDGQIIEVPIKESAEYENNLKDIYGEILKVRRFYNLSDRLPEKPEVGRKMKI